MSREQGSASAGERALSAALDELYAAPFDAFVSLRRELSARLRAAGDGSGARQIASAAKPTRTAWALNQVARKRPEIVAEIVRSRAAAATAQKAGDSKAIREGARGYRDAIAEGVSAVRSVLAEDGVALSSGQARRVGETLQALATDVREGSKLGKGHLTRDVEVDEIFAGIEVESEASGQRAGEAHTRDTHAREKKEREEKEREEHAREERASEAKERAVEEALARVRALDDAVATARKATTEAEREVRRAQYDADKASRALAALETRLDQAREELKKRSGAP
jgi:hypothetical protein